MHLQVQMFVQEPSKGEVKFGQLELTDNAAGMLLVGQLDAGSMLVGSKGLVSVEDSKALKRPHLDAKLTLSAAANGKDFCPTPEIKPAKLCGVSAAIGGFLARSPTNFLMRGSFVSPRHTLGADGSVAFWNKGDQHKVGGTPISFGLGITYNARYEGVSPYAETDSQWRRGMHITHTS